MQSRLKYKLILLCLGMGALFAACQPPSQHGRIITDMRGRHVRVPVDVKRIACIGRGSLRMISYLHGADLVVGVEYPERKQTSHVRPYLIAYPNLRTLPSIGHGAKGDPELLLKVHPQVIFYADGDLQAVEMMQSKTGIPVVYITCGNLDDGRPLFYNCLNLMALILDKQARCDSLIQYIEQQFLEIRQIVNNNRVNSVSAYVGGMIFKGRHGITSTQANYVPFKLLNLRNVVSDVGGKVNHPVQIHIEQLIKWNPDVIYIDKACSQQVYQEVKSAPLLRKLAAFKNRRSFEIFPSRLYGENFETTLLNTFIMANSLIHHDLDIWAKAEEIYAAFLSENVASYMLQTYGDTFRFDLE